MSEIGKFSSPLLILILCVGQILADIPRFTVEPQSGFINPGTSLILSCDVLPHSINIRWIFNGTQVVPDRRRGVDVHEGTLRISAFNQSPLQSKQGGGAGGGPGASPEEGVSHEGVYQCVATGQAGSIVSREAHLQLAVLSSYEGTRSVEDIEVMEGNVAMIPCQSPVSRPKAVVEFDFNGTRIVPSGRHVILPSCGLQIAGVKSSDAGIYQYAAYNSVVGNRARAPVQYRLKVKEGGTKQAPVFVRTSPSSRTAVLGEELSLECVAEGWPVPNVTWEKYGGHLPTGRYRFVFGNLIISEVQMFDAGTYLCKISNDEGDPQAKVISVEVHEPPVIDASPAHQTVKEGETVQFKCKVHGSPEVTVDWYHNASPIQNRPSVTITDTSLVLTNVRGHQRGMYQCIARNYLGMTHASARLSVVEPTSSSVQATGSSGKLPSSSSNHIPSHEFGGGSDADYRDEMEGSRDYEEYGEMGGGKYGGIKADRSNSGDQHGLRHGGINNPSGDLLVPSRPEISRVTDSSVLVQWSLTSHSLATGLGISGTSAAISGPSSISSFILQFKDLGDGLSTTLTSSWRTAVSEIPASLRMHELTRIRAGSYRFRLIAVYSNGELRHGPPSHRFTVGSRHQNKIALPAPIIVEVRPLTISEIFIGWQQLDTDQWPIDGFYIYYAPYADMSSTSENSNKNLGVGSATAVGALVGEEQRKMVQGASVRHAVLSHLRAGAQYRVRMQSYSAMLGESEFSNIIFKRTLGSTEDSPPPYAAASGGTHGSMLSKDGVLGGTGGPESGQSDSEKIYTRDMMSQKTAENQFLYIALGTVLGVVVLVTVLCITMCIWKQHKRQHFSGSFKERQSLQCSNGVGVGSIGGTCVGSNGGAINPKTSSLINSMLMRPSHPTPPSSTSHLTTPSHISGLPPQYGVCKDQGNGPLAPSLCPQDTAAALALRDNAASYQLKLGSGTLMSRKQPELVLPPPPPLPLPPGYCPSPLHHTGGDICRTLSNSAADPLSIHSGDTYDPMDHLYSRLEDPTPHPESHNPSIHIDQFLPRSQPQGHLPHHTAALRRDVGIAGVAVACPSVASLTAGNHRTRMSPDHIPRSHERRLVGHDLHSGGPAGSGPSRHQVHRNPLVDSSHSGGSEIFSGSGGEAPSRNRPLQCYQDDRRSKHPAAQEWQHCEGGYSDDEVEEDDNLMRDQGTSTDLLSNNGATSVYTTESDSNAYSSLDGRSLDRSSPSQHLPISHSSHAHNSRPGGSNIGFCDRENLSHVSGPQCHDSNVTTNCAGQFNRSRDIVKYDPVTDAGYDIENVDDEEDEDDEFSLRDESSSGDRRRLGNRLR